MHNRAAIDLPSMDKIINSTDNRNPTKHHNAVVHIRDRWVVEEREEADHGLKDAEEDSNDVDRDTLQ